MQKKDEVTKFPPTIPKTSSNPLLKASDEFCPACFLFDRIYEMLMGSFWVCTSRSEIKIQAFCSHRESSCAMSFVQSKEIQAKKYLKSQ